jgi:hypothetical protein
MAAQGRDGVVSYISQGYELAVTSSGSGTGSVRGWAVAGTSVATRRAAHAIAARIRNDSV